MNYLKATLCGDHKATNGTGLYPVYTLFSWTCDAEMVETPLRLWT